MVGNFNKNQRGISIDPFMYLGSSSVQSTPDMENKMKNIFFSASSVLWTELEPKYKER
jgi:hypothetical protein